ncbi:MAG: sulfite exporter TauE/SafE family protein [Acidimicrobiia bacterium]
MVDGRAVLPGSRTVLIGVATGALSGLLGVGGGIVMVPSLVAFGFSRHRANGTSLAAILLVASSGAIAFAVAGDLDWQVGVTLGIGGLVGSTLGANLMNRLHGNTLGLIFGVVLLITGLRMVLAGDTAVGGDDLDPALRVAIGVLVGMVAGLASGLAGVGGGVVMVPAMVFFLGLDQHTAEGTSLLAILFTAVAATRINTRNRHVDWRAMLILGLVGAVTAPLATLVAQSISAPALTRVFGVLVVLMAARTIVRSRQAPETALT